MRAASECTKAICPPRSFASRGVFNSIPRGANHASYKSIIICVPTAALCAMASMPASLIISKDALMHRRPIKDGLAI